MKPVLILLMLLATPVAAHDLRYDPAILWLDAPNTTGAGDARIRLVFHGQQGAAVLTPNQYWAYSEYYRKRLARLSLTRSVSRAIPQARHQAFHDTLRQFPNLRVDGLKIQDISDDRLLPRY